MDEVLKRIDAHLGRGNELMELNRVASDRNGQAFERNRQAFERNSEAFERNSEAFERNSEAFERNSEALDRNNEALDRNNEAFERNREVMEATQEELRLNRKVYADNREFMRQLTLRHERASNTMITEIKGLSTAVLDSVAELRDLRGEAQAQRRALLRLIDRLPPPGGGDS